MQGFTGRSANSTIVSSALRLAVDARDLATDTRGIGRYTRAIVRRLVRRDDVELTLLVRGPLPFLKSKALAATAGSDRFRVSSRASGCDVVWHPANGMFFEERLPNVVTIHDAVPFRFPDPDPQRREHQQKPFVRSIRNAARVIAVSRFGRDEVADVFGFPAERIDVIYHGVEPVFSPGCAATKTPYFLFVGDPYSERRKNFPLLYDAYCDAFHGRGPALAMVGPTDPQKHGVRYEGLAAGDAQGSGDERLRDLYRGAIALCVPSFYETFGMPMIEAMACGTPVLASDTSCLPEIGGQAALYAPPHDRTAWSRILQSVAEEPQLRERLREAGIARARAFDWDESARLHVE